MGLFKKGEIVLSNFKGVNILKLVVVKIAYNVTCNSTDFVQHLFL